MIIVMKTIQPPSDVITLIRMMNASGHACYLVGGAVRSALLALPVSDYDLTTSASPQETEAVFAQFRIIETGLKHGTVTVLFHGTPYEITTFRKDMAYSDHRHPDRVAFSSSLREDCARRDFTVNALCWHPDEGLIDFFDGLKDLQEQRIRCIGLPDDRFNEDALRILRAMRFAARLHFTIEENTLASLIRNRKLLQYVSRERIRSELIGLLEAPKPGAVMLACRPVLDEVMPLKEPFADTCRLVDQALPDALVRFCLLLPEGDPEPWLREMTFTAKEIHSAKQILAYKDLPLASVPDIRYALSRLDDFGRYAAFRKAYDNVECMSSAREIMARGDCVSLKQLAVNGRDVQAAGFRGKQISTVLEQCLLAVMKDAVRNEKEQLLAYMASL